MATLETAAEELVKKLEALQGQVDEAHEKLEVVGSSAWFGAGSWLRPSAWSLPGLEDSRSWGFPVLIVPRLGHPLSWEGAWSW